MLLLVAPRNLGELIIRLVPRSILCNARKGQGLLTDAMIPRIYRSGVVTCLAVAVMLVACTGGSEPAAPATTVAVGATTQPANTLVPAPTATPAPTVAASTAAVGVSGDCAGHRDALVALYNTTNGDNWRGKDNWLSDHPVDTWFGITADSDGCVTQLVLERNYLIGEIPPELSSLANLEVMIIDANQLSGGYRRSWATSPA